MKIARLDLLRFGAFDDHSLDLADGDRGLFVIHGPNEAGKSTTLRAVRGLLFGIDERTDDDFRHKKPDLRIGARIVGDDGTVLEVIRKKGRKHTLLELDNKTPADEERFVALLGSTTTELYAAAFGLDHESLRNGGTELLQGAGDVGKALFGAGVGARALRDLQTGLDRQIDGLWKKGGKNPRLNALLREHRDCQQQLRDVTVAESAWRDCEDAHRRAVAAHDAAQQRLREQELRYERLDRLQRTVGPAREWRTLHAALAAYDDLPELAEDFGAQRTQIDARVDAATRDAARARAEREQIETERARHRLGGEDRDLLEAHERFDELHLRFGSYRSDREAVAAVGDDGTPPPDDPERALATIAELRRLTEQHASLVEALDGEERDRDEALRVRDLAAAALHDAAEPGDIAALEHTLADVGPSAHAAEQLAEARAAAAREERDVAQRLAALGRWRADAAALATAALPSRATVRAAVRADDERDGARRKLLQQRADATERAARCRRELDALERGEVPDPERLDGSRLDRETLWREVRARWLGEARPPQGFDGDDAQLAASHEEATRSADRIADLLRDRADAVARRAATQADLAAAERLLADCDRSEAEAATAAEEAIAGWSATWVGLPVAVGTPAEMEEWLQQADALREAVRSLENQRAALGTRADEVGAARARLAAVLEARGVVVDPDSTLPALVRTAGATIDRDRAAQQERDQREHAHKHAGRDLATAEERVARCAAKLAAWKVEWREHALALDLDLDPDAAPGVARAELTRIERACQTARRRRGMAAFEAELDRFVRATAPTLADRPTDEVFAEVGRRIAAARTTVEIRSSLDQRLTQNNEGLRKAEDALAACRDARDRLLRPIAAAVTRDGVVDEAALDAVVSRLATRDELRRQRHQCEGRLQSAGGGLGLQDLLAEAEGSDPDQVAAERAAARDELERLKEARDRAHEELVTARNALAELRGQDTAAHLGEQLERITADIAEEARRLRTLVAARTILTREIERYREQHQGPVLERARELFATLSRGEFVDLEVDYGPDDGLRLLAVRGDGDGLRHPALAGNRVGVDGLSEGTRDQLFLALKVATIEEMLQKPGAPRLPVVLDDVLVHFDDDRARAALEVFARLAATTQVLLFTHHQHVAELALRVDAELRPPAGIFVRQLTPEPAVREPAV